MTLLSAIEQLGEATITTFAGSGPWALLTLCLLVALGYLGWRAMRAAERSLDRLVDSISSKLGEIVKEVKTADKGHTQALERLAQSHEVCSKEWAEKYHSLALTILDRDRERDKDSK